MPDRLESGTLNTAGIIGLGAGIDFVNQRGGVCKLRKTLDRQFDSKDVGCMSADNRLGIVPDCISERFYPTETARQVYCVREKVAAFFGAEDAGQVVFTQNCTAFDTSPLILIP